MAPFLLPEADESAVCSVNVWADGFVDDVTVEELEPAERAASLTLEADDAGPD
ncbi:hypothetical protein GCM10022223_15920 [Kineosporia mesophila]|uniref:Uncharacterized protein n=1 Tax=Kineosporia mesophila TaxID=566012 RepID=A0ABP6Z8C9_9ACTN|nr:hypothetical protein [Kineosporia mesophila]MCD5354884.1 hypothetical protein [Kineosporia mesophila]